MATISEMMATAFAHHEAGHLHEAKAFYRQVLRKDSLQADAWHLLGVVAHQLGLNEIAVEHINQAIQLNANEARYHTNLGVALFSLNKFEDAAACYQHALALDPELADVHFNLGNVWSELRKTEEAIASYRRAADLKPDDVVKAIVLGNTLKLDGRLEHSLVHYQRALEKNPNNASLLCTIGQVMQDLGRLEDAESCYQRALQITPDIAGAHNNLGNLYQARGETLRAEESYRQALRADPNHVDGHINLASCLWRRGQLESAAEHLWQATQLRPNSALFQKRLADLRYSLGDYSQAISLLNSAIRLDPMYVDALIALGVVYRDLQQLNEAERALRQALALEPDCAEAYFNLGTVALARKDIEYAIPLLRRAVELRPNFTSALCELVRQKQYACQWDDLEALSLRVHHLVMGVEPRDPVHPVGPFIFMGLPIPTTSEQQRLAAHQWCEMKVGTCTGQRRFERERPVKKERLTIGYMTGEFNNHPIAFLTAGLFGAHDRNKVSVHGYSYGADDGHPIRERIRQGFDQFADISNFSHTEAAALIARDGVDILVDLSGYTGPARTQILAQRPAPIQVNYLGYPGTLAAEFMDYILVDAVCVPPDQQPFFAEKLVHLPGCYQVNDNTREIALPTPSRRECGLPEKGFVFCCFNSNYKITSEVFSIWMRLLTDVPGSVLWLLASNESAPVNLRREAETRGVEANRLIFVRWKPQSEHLARYRLADLFLDTLSYNAHTTGSDALWAGCPMLTATGDTFPSRVATSQLLAVGLKELITPNLTEYEQTALRLARNPEELVELRSRLQTNLATAPLFDTTRFARNLETAYHMMWKYYVENDEPRAFSVPDSGPSYTI